ncbi:MAG: hypothetical protein KDD25_09085 [Bdellovibrionales bacterium]|nr:hypothetical protein [Bdellovibrionales bacterium]
MSENQGNKNEQKQNKKGSEGGQVIPLKCAVGDCKTRPSKAQFCSDHYVWFKEGLITKEGQRAKDFDKKYQHFLRRHPKAA